MTPFPWHQLPQLHAKHLDGLVDLAAVAHKPAFNTLLSDLLQTPCKVEHGRVTAHPTFHIDLQDGFVARATTVPENLPFYVWMPATTCTGLLPALFEAPSHQLTPEQWGAHAALCLGALHTAINQGLMPCRLEANPPPAELTARDLAQPTSELTVVFRATGLGRHFLRLLFPLPTVRELTTHSTPTPWFDDALGRALLNLDVRANFGNLPPNILLEPGDILLADHDLRTLLKNTNVRLSHHTLHGEIADQNPLQFNLQHIETRTMADETTSLTHTELDVEVRLGRIKLPIAQLATLAPGTVLPLDARPGDPVDILIANQLVARAELVLVDDRIACRILQRLK